MSGRTELSLPDPTWLTQPFWDAAKEGKLLCQQCDVCKRYFFPPEVACTDCLSQQMIQGGCCVVIGPDH